LPIEYDAYLQKKTQSQRTKLDVTNIKVIFIYKAKYKIQVSFHINTKEHPQNKKPKVK
jgi:hypothetical protein